MSYILIKTAKHIDEIHDADYCYIPAGIYLLKVKYRNTRTRCEICPKLTIKTPEF